MGAVLAAFGIGEAGGGGKYQKAVKTLEDVSTPGLNDLKVDLNELVVVGQLTPEEADAILQEASAMEDIQQDPELRQNQLSAIAALEEIANEGGMNAQDRSKLEQLKTELAGQEQGKRQAILQGAQERGVGGSGIELASQMQNQQSSATRASQQGMDIQAQSEQRALEAILQGAQMSGDVRDQDFSEQARVAEAADAINKFNTANRQQTEFTNVDARNQAQAQNLAEQQRVADTNVDIQNQQQAADATAYQQAYNNEMGKAGALADVHMGRSDQENEASKSKTQFMGDVIGAGATALSASDRRVKNNIEEFDSSEFLNEITGYKYNYKKPETHGEGDQVGVMAQDVEKVAPQAVNTNEDGVKEIDYNRLGGPILAALSDLNKRLTEQEDK